MLTFEQKCENFTILLNEAAQEQGCFFVGDSGEGHDMETENLYCEDSSGWLIPNARKEEHESTDREDNRWDEYSCFAEWSQDGDNIIIEFKEYTI